MLDIKNGSTITRLNDCTKSLLLGNIELLRFCNSVGIDSSRLSNCSINKMGYNFIFTLIKSDYKKNENCFIDLGDKVDIVLLMKYNEVNNHFDFETTDYTVRLLNINS